MGSRTSMVSRKNMMVINFAQSHDVEFQSIFRAPSQKLKILAIPNVLAHSRKFKILTIPNVLAHGKSYEHGFMKKCDNYKLYAKSRVKSSFVQFFMHRLKNSRYWPFPTY
ncbi:hypothetical protein BHE74_00000523 [Ensete ventricosum]|nr:hypothetical protein GW17_00052675 [Ensete ventricosum]RWW90367.1 hypothetical protein BHE74_00000523 [Ensete ventricosum]RZR75744.1 hypothetical protein BHM03_00000224 [Ensete ventricosum]